MSHRQLWADRLEEIKGQSTCSVEDAARALGIGRTLAYQLARTKGELGPGIPVLAISSRLVVPCQPLLKALGIDVEP